MVKRPKCAPVNGQGIAELSEGTRISVIARVQRLCRGYPPWLCQQGGINGDVARCVMGGAQEKGIARLWWRAVIRQCHRQPGKAERRASGIVLARDHGGAGRGIHNIEGWGRTTTGKLEAVIVERELRRIEDADTLQCPAAGIRRQSLTRDL